MTTQITASEPWVCSVPCIFILFDRQQCVFNCLEAQRVECTREERHCSCTTRASDNNQ